MVSKQNGETLTDIQLLDGFRAHQDQAAFALLVKRHGPMVLEVCRHVLRHHQDAEDAFQATFLVLARKSTDIRKKTALASWLHGVAYRMAMNAKRSAARRRKHEGRTGVPPVSATGGTPVLRAQDPAWELGWREVQAVLDEEIERLPEKYRAVFVLCCLEGIGRAEAGRQLGLKEGTVSSRLDQARKRLQQRLARRGVTLSSVLAAAALAQNAAAAAVPPLLVNGTLRAAQLLAAGETGAAGAISANVVRLVEGAGRAMLMTKLRIGTVLFLAAGALAGGVGLAAHQVLAVKATQGKQEEAKPADAAQPTAIAEKEKQARTDRYGDPLPPNALVRMGTVRFRHGDQIEGIALAPDGRTLAAASRDQTVRIWNVVTGQELRRLPGHEGSLRYVAFWPDGTMVATIGNPPGVVHLWDAATGKELRQLQGNIQLGPLAISPDGRFVAADNANHVIMLWEKDTGRLVHQFDTGEKKFFGGPIAFSPDSRTLASGGEVEMVRLWNLATGKEERRFDVKPPLPKEKTGPPHDAGMVRALAFSPDGRILASSAWRCPVRVWEVATHKEIRSLQVDGAGAFALAFSPNGKTLVSGGLGSVRVWEVATGKEVRRFQAPQGWVSGVAFADNGRTLVSSIGSTIRLWEVATGKEIVPDRGHSARISSCILLPDRRTLVTGSSDNTIRWWDLATGKELDRFTAGSGSFYGVNLSPNGAFAACTKEETVGETESQLGIQLWDLKTRKKLALLWQPNIFGGFFCPDGKTLITQAWDVKERAGVFRLWDMATGKELRIIARIANGPQGSALSPDGKLLAGVWQGQDTNIDLWDATTGKRLHHFPGDRDFNQCLAFSPDSKLLVVADGPRTWGIDSRVLYQHIHLWDVATGKKILQFGRSSSGYWPVTFSADGKTLVTAGEDNRIRLWEVATGGERLRLEGHGGRVQGLLFTDDGRTLISTSDDTTALVWDVTGLRKVERLPAVHLSPQELEERLAMLVGDDPRKAHAASWKLVAGAERSVPWMKAHLRPAPTADSQRLARLLDDLNSDRFPVREKATGELESLAESAEPALQKALLGKPTLEVRRRVEQLLGRLRGPVPPGNRLQALRAVEALEHIGTSEAEQILESLAKGASEARVTQEAKASLDRLKKRAAKKP
jgi:RNA polymerase sigma factor (sigma-70 family)